MRNKQYVKDENSFRDATNIILMIRYNFNPIYKNMMLLRVNRREKEDHWAENVSSEKSQNCTVLITRRQRFLSTSNCWQDTERYTMLRLCYIWLSKLGSTHIAHEVPYDEAMKMYKVCDISGKDSSCSNKFDPDYSYDITESKWMAVLDDKMRDIRSSGDSFG
jgi:hypothetical protein